jgi:hypothetical protein
LADNGAKEEGAEIGAYANIKEQKQPETVALFAGRD